LPTLVRIEKMMREDQSANGIPLVFGELSKGVVE
jgi:hypothetical protein